MQLSDGRRLVFRTRRNTLTVPAVRRGVRGAVRVRGLTAAGMRGTPATARVGRR